MATKWLIGAGIAVAAIGLVVGGAAFAASSTAAPELAREAAAYALMPMMLGRMGGLADDGEAPIGFRGRLHEYMVEQVAAALNLSVDDLQAKLADGQTLAAVAEGQGVAQEDLADLLKEAWTKALTAAVADGVLTQEQADWMADHPMVLRAAGARMGGPRGRDGMGWGSFGRPWYEESNEGSTNG